LQILGRTQKMQDGLLGFNVTVWHSLVQFDNHMAAGLLGTALVES
jgi:hypothetical protein